MIWNILCDALGDRMSLIKEYGDRREQKGRNDGKKEGMKELISSILDAGESIPEISKKTEKSVEELEEIIKD